MQTFISRTRVFLLMAIGVAFFGCSKGSSTDVVVYTALDRKFSEPILNDYKKSASIEVLPKFDVESTKTVGLVEAIIAEKDRPRCDLFWNNEILNTVRLKKLGLLEMYLSKSASSYPSESYDKNDFCWHGFAARVRILIVNTRKLKPDEYPKSVSELSDPKWRGRVGLAKPLFGTTATHMAVLFAADEARATKWFTDVKANDAKIMSGNKQVATAVASGQLDWGLTDTDDALVEIASGLPVKIVIPDQAEGGVGALLIPNTLAIIKGSPNTEGAKKLVDYLLANNVEDKLAVGPSGQLPLSLLAQAKPKIEGINSAKFMNVDWDKAAEVWPAAMKVLREKFTID
jgi:iron(III) transport system substrate-binding protein